jgi:hypothetical protein
MPRTTSIFQVFVASPSDVADERKVLEDVITQLNQIWSSSLGIIFELVKWETNVHPTFSTDPQAAINEQIGLNYDVFIGIFWGRIGTPTPRADSGTLEEFHRAYKQFAANKAFPEIMIYFKDAAIQPSKIDTEQLQRVKDFRESLAGKGGLYSMFEDQAGFESSLRSHLSALAQKFSIGQRSGMLLRNTNIREQSNRALPEVTEEDDYGYLDYTEIHTSRQEEINTAMNVISEAVIRLGEQLTQRTSEMGTIDKSSTKDVRRNAKRAADDMNSFADVVSTQVGIMSAARKVAYDALSNALALQTDFTTNHSDLAVLKETLISVIESIDSAKSSTSAMRTSTNSLPRITKELNIAKRAVVSNLDLVISEFEIVSSTISNILEAIDRILDAGGDNAQSA